MVPKWGHEERPGPSSRSVGLRSATSLAVTSRGGTPTVVVKIKRRLYGDRRLIAGDTSRRPAVIYSSQLAGSLSPRSPLALPQVPAFAALALLIRHLLSPGAPGPGANCCQHMNRAHLLTRNKQANNASEIYARANISISSKSAAVIAPRLN